MDCSVGPVHYSRDSQTSFFNKTFIKNESRGTIHTFKIYFAIVFSIFSFKQNKQYPNGPLVIFLKPHINYRIQQLVLKLNHSFKN